MFHRSICRAWSTTIFCDSSCTQALPPLQGSPIALLLECLSYSSRDMSHPSTESAKVETTLTKGGCCTSQPDLCYNYIIPQLLTTDAAIAECRRMEGELLLERGKMEQAWSALSGGERQRSIIACALILAGTMRSSDSDRTESLSGSVEEGVTGCGVSVCDAVLLLDEPTAACDAAACAAVEKAVAASGAAVVVVTHDDKQAQRMAHRRVVLAMHA